MRSQDLCCKTYFNEMPLPFDQHLSLTPSWTLIGVNIGVSVCLSKASWQLPGIFWAPVIPSCTKDPPQRGDISLAERKTNFFFFSQQDLISVWEIHSQGTRGGAHLLLLLGSNSRRNRRPEGKRPRARTDGRCRPLHSCRRARPAPCSQKTKALACLIRTG